MEVLKPGFKSSDSLSLFQLLVCNKQHSSQVILTNIGSNKYFRGVVNVMNMPRYGYYSQARTAVQLDRYQKDSGAV